MAKQSVRRIVLTGVSRGLGRAMTEGFIGCGHQVWGCARDVEAVEELARRWPSPHRFEVVDVARDDQVAQWADRAREAAFVPDLLINNAAIVNRNAVLWQVPPDEMAELLAVNVAGVVNCIRHFVPLMIARSQGVIVNFSSYWGRSAAAEVAPYCATKWAIEGLTRALAEEVPRGMAAVPLNPGVINTDMLRSCFGAAAGSYPDPQDWSRRAVPFILALGPADNAQPHTVPGE